MDETGRKRRWDEIDLTDSSEGSPSPKVPILTTELSNRDNSYNKRRGQPGLYLFFLHTTFFSFCLFLYCLNFVFEKHTYLNAVIVF